MDVHDLPEALNAPPNTTVELALSRILTASGLTPGELLPKLYDPANRAVLDLLRQGTNADTITDQWDRINPPVQTFTPAPVPPAPVAPNAPEGSGPITWNVVTNAAVPVEAPAPKVTAGPTTPPVPVTGAAPEATPSTSTPGTESEAEEAPKVPSSLDSWEYTAQQIIDQLTELLKGGK